MDYSRRSFMKKAFFKIGFIACLIMSAIFAVLLISKSIIMSNAVTNGLSVFEYLNSVKVYTVLLFVFGIGTVIFKSIEICKE